MGLLTGGLQISIKSNSHPCCFLEICIPSVYRVCRIYQFVTKSILRSYQRHPILPGGTYSPGNDVPLLGRHRKTHTLTGTKIKKPIPLLAHNLHDLGRNSYPYQHKNRWKPTLVGTTRRKLCQIKNIFMYWYSTIIVIQKLFLDMKFGA